MRPSYTTEIIFVWLVIALSLVGFSSLYIGEETGPNAYQSAHIVTSLAWLLLLVGQLVVLRQRRSQLHRTIGLSIFGAGPLLVGTLTLLTVHSAAKDAVVGRADALVVQNVMVTVEVALLVWLAFYLRRNRAVHGALLLSTALLFMGIALFFTLISYVPGYRSEAGSMPRFADAAQGSASIGSVVGLLFFLRQRRTGWPWLLTSAFFFLNGFLQMFVDRADRTRSLTQLVASIGRAPAFALGLTLFAALLWMAWRAAPTTQKRRGVMPEAASL